MKKKRFSVEQITAVLQQAEAGTPVGDLCRQVGVAEQTFYRWKKAVLRRRSVSCLSVGAVARRSLFMHQRPS